MDPTVMAVGLERVVGPIEQIWGAAVHVGPVQKILGPVFLAGSSGPSLSSAAAVTLAGDTVWIPAPIEPAEPTRGLAPIYLHGGRPFVMPHVRLLVPAAADRGSKLMQAESRKDRDELAVEYLSLPHWFEDALERWQFPVLSREPADSDGSARGQSTLRQALPAANLAPGQGLRIVAQLIRYALFGADRSFVLGGLRFPPCPMWLRPVEGGPFAHKTFRSLVISARLASTRFALIPSTELRAERLRMQPVRHDWGIDPVHTPEGADIRLTGRLGAGVRIGPERQLQVPDAHGPFLSSSSSRLPFAGYNDPRRLLMAAAMQVHALHVAGAGESKTEQPLVRNDPEGLDPPGVNLRCAFLAWRGWNHEDAWVLSESAAGRLVAVTTAIHTSAIGSMELPPEVLVSEGQRVERGALLLRRSAAPALLCSSLDILGRLADLTETVPLEPKAADHAEDEGIVEKIEVWDLLTGKNVPPDILIAPHLPASFRMVYRFHIRRQLPLRVGDKLANRHGHKGIVGAILPDRDMPRWLDEPLEALIDPISVLNRSNWGQLFEGLAGALALTGEPVPAAGSMTGPELLTAAAKIGADEHGRWEIQPPLASAWMRTPVKAAAGVQFVMRLPHHAVDKISAAPLPASAAPSLRRRAQRFGEMDSWALWAHGVLKEINGPVHLNAAARRLGRLLLVAGFDLQLQDESVRVCRRPTEPPTPCRAFDADRSRSRAYDELDALGTDPLTVLYLDPPIADVRLPGSDGAAQSDSDQGDDMVRPATRDLHWLPVLPAGDRPPRRDFDGAEKPHELTLCYRRILRPLRQRRQGELDPAVEDELRQAVEELMRLALALAVGTQGAGALSSKFAWLRRHLLGRRVAPSARASVSPAGPLGLGLDEVGIPPTLARILVGDDTDIERWVWLKRDPVLHRWGLVPVRVRIVPGDTIRLPASLLGPMGADFDGDTMALFAALPGTMDDIRMCRPSKLAWHPLLKQPMFLPGKQYLFGLALLAEDRDGLKSLQDALASAGAPAWPAHLPADQASAAWVQAAAQAEAPQGAWWGILEHHALQALAAKPDMDFGIWPAEELACLRVVTCKAAKDLYQQGPARVASQRILSGRSLEIYRRPQAAALGDPIADVMVAAKTSIGFFGGALRRILYTARSLLLPLTVQQAQSLTEQVTQKALSVKAGKSPLRYPEFERQLRKLLAAEPWDRDVSPELQELLDSIKEIGASLRAAMAGPPEIWLDWLRKPHELPKIMAALTEFHLPVGDLRLRLWLE